MIISARIILVRCVGCGAEFIRGEQVPDPCKKCGKEMKEVREVSKRELRDVLSGKGKKP